MKQINLYPSNEIIYLRGIENYTELYLVNGEKVVSSYTLLRYQERHTNFLRVNKSHLLNPRFVAKVHSMGNEREVELKSGKVVKVSRRRRDVLVNLK